MNGNTASLILDNLPWVWFAVTVLCAGFEALTLGLTTVWFALGALVMVFLSLLPIPPVVQVLLFLLISGALLAFTRPLAVRRLRVGKEKTNADSLIGERAQVTRKVTEFDGEVKVHGLSWSARPDGKEELEPGTVCVIRRLEGVTLYVAAEKENTGNGTAGIPGENQEKT